MRKYSIHSTSRFFSHFRHLNVNPVEIVNENEFRISPQQYLMDDLIEIEGDASSSTSALGMAAVASGRVTITNVGRDSCQGDAEFGYVLQRMGCQCTKTLTTTTIERLETNPLVAVDVDLSSMTDSFMTLAACAAVAEGTTSIRNIANQRLKECNRIQVRIRTQSWFSVGSDLYRLV
jgi:pentafunctional AROM polypeptide